VSTPAHSSPETLEAHLAADVAAIVLDEARARLGRIERGEGNEHGFAARAPAREEVRLAGSGSRVRVLGTASWLFRTPRACSPTSVVGPREPGAHPKGPRRVALRRLWRPWRPPEGQFGNASAVAADLQAAFASSLAPSAFASSAMQCISRGTHRVPSGYSALWGESGA
jgi:hypothetical protein